MTLVDRTNREELRAVVARHEQQIRQEEEHKMSKSKKPALRFKGNGPSYFDAISHTKTYFLGRDR